MFYYLDFLFLIVGLVFLFGKDRRLWLFLIALILLAPIPSAITMMGVEYSLRAILIYPIFTLLIGLGIWAVFSFAKSKSYRRGIATVIFTLYLIQFLNFLNIYFFRNPIYNSEGFGFSQRVMVNYLKQAKSKNKKVIVVGGNSLDVLKHYLFYQQNFNQDSLVRVREMIASGQYHWESIYFLPKCPQSFSVGEKETLILLPGNDNCLSEKKLAHRLSISQLGDGGEVLKIFNDSLCSVYELYPYSFGLKFSDFKIEELPLENFCQKFISDTTGYVDFKKKKGI